MDLRRPEDARFSGRNPPKPSTPSEAPIKVSASSPAKISPRQVRNLRHQDGLLKSLNPSTDPQTPGACGPKTEDRFERPVPASNVVRAFAASPTPADLGRGRLDGGCF